MSPHFDHDDSEDGAICRSQVLDDSVSRSSESGDPDQGLGHPWFQHRGPAERRDDGAPFDPSEEWRAAFRAQATKETFTAALGYAYKKAELVEIAGIQVDDDYVAALVQDAIGDTIAGQIRWRFDRVSLANHLKDTIRLRTYRQIVRARKYRHESIDFVKKRAAAHGNPATRNRHVTQGR